MGSGELNLVGNFSSDDAIKLAVRLAMEAGDLERAKALLDVLGRTSGGEGEPVRAASVAPHIAGRQRH